MVYKRSIKKDGRVLGPYYYHNFKTDSGKIKTIYLGSRKPNPLSFMHIVIIALFFLIIASGILFLSQINLIYPQEEAKKSNIETDQLLIKVLLREGEFITKQLSVMNIGRYSYNIKISIDGLGNLISVDQDSFNLQQGETKSINLNLITKDQSRRTYYSPGIYIGRLIIKSEDSIKIVPLIIEIESKEVLFDMNLNLNTQDRTIQLGESRNIEIRLFNLGRIKPANVLMEYNIRSLNGETISTETETAVIESQTSFFKTIKIPENLNPGQYVFTSKATYGTSLGTSSYLFDVKTPEIRKSEIYSENIANFLTTCSGEPSCWITLFILILLLFILGSYTYFFIGAYFYSRINKNFLYKPTHDFKLERMYEEHPVKHHTAWPFIIIAIVLSLATVGLLYYKNLLPNVMVYLSMIKFSEYIYITPNINLYFNLIIGGLIIFLTALFILRSFLKK